MRKTQQCVTKQKFEYIPVPSQLIDGNPTFNYCKTQVQLCSVISFK